MRANVRGTMMESNGGVERANRDVASGAAITEGWAVSFSGVHRAWYDGATGPQV